MALPKRRHSKSRRDKRRTHDRLSLPQTTLCPQCNEPKLPHRVCLACGTYKGKTVLEVKEI
ncbi:MAG: 50S ribosomal protein L32 [Deltaproteobacteria bacterium CG12_big_fil_rev_8_21_14_0_65_43_10]|nr:MAG: 50S ribosomal protein L32 [Deltaproteobacteria bacterium CG12_big_fil_rev_8_21_14_0_65_43_10]PIU84502.1 MAG: 50S ribosomal protein L32 [Deltaproteobacteria bacterium CG06_land_8_20_14_3_00_44_19]PIX23394.1 MAG: 50S ribosomal protein L32 [Deltaproteobacteria bacterium CG_4_8_14_3_um_filter_43_13]PIZ21184.1 MAG: 50S ribosomal protein L32 [Deltaproteobacteria bacterium CG_4_10_14_0_8_um_filter_43_12]HCX89765.1 50S ribosomal protein L32 [Deltaproteobacteria bacterium]